MQRLTGFVLKENRIEMLTLWIVFVLLGMSIKKKTINVVSEHKKQLFVLLLDVKKTKGALHQWS